MASAADVSVYSFTTSDCGEYNGEADSSTSIGMPPNSQVSINGSTDLSSCIAGPHDAKVYSIILTKPGGIYEKYEVSVVAEGPHGAFSGGTDLHFQDATGDTYTLNITSSDKKTHTVEYGSSAPNLVKITWAHTWEASETKQK